MSILKNVAGQKVAVYAYDAANDAVIGDAANITAQLAKDGGVSASTDDAIPTELDATNHPGVYIFDLLQAETNALQLVISPASSTGGVSLDVLQIFTADDLLPTINNIDTNVATVLTNTVAIENKTDIIDTNVDILIGRVPLSGTVDSTNFAPTITQFECDDILEATTDHFVRVFGRVIIFTSGALLHQAVYITAYSFAAGRSKFTVVAMTEEPADDDTFDVI
jgi:hypothetical protein